MLPPLACFLLAALAPLGARGESFVNWETPHVHPLEATPDGARLLAVNTADGRLEVFDLAGGFPVHALSIPVGIDPVSVRVRPGAPNEAWVANHLSDSISVVDLATGNTVATLRTEDEPADVVFAGVPERAFVSCSQANSVLVFDPSDRNAAPLRIAIAAEDPRAMAVSRDGSEVYVAVFESGNGSTILNGGTAPVSLGELPRTVDDPDGPHGGVNPPPNDNGSFEPPIAAGLPPPPRVSLIVKKDAAGRFRDDTHADWTELVSGSQAAKSLRPVGWDLPDRDVAVIDVATLGVGYATRLMNICMAIAVNPATDEVTVVGTDATNEIRYEPNVKGTFVRVRFARVDPSGPTSTAVGDLNPHLTYRLPTLPEAVRNRAIGDPRGIAWNRTGTRAYVTGMGSNNVVVIDSKGLRAGLEPTIPVGEGPTGIAFDVSRGRLYVLNKFEATISTIDVASEVEVGRTPFFDPSPESIVRGRRHLYDTHETSGLGQAACGSCHVDARMDRLAWDLGDPGGAMKSVQGQNLFFGFAAGAGPFEDWHPMKGPTTTQTLQDIIGLEPLHWRGDKNGLEEFNGAFRNLQGDDEELTPAEMQEFEDFLATIHFPPNPHRNLDNSLPASLPLPGHFATGDFAAAGVPLPPGDAQRGLELFRPPNFVDGGVRACTQCHTLPTGVGTNLHLTGIFMEPFPTGPDGEKHTALASTDGFTNVTMKIAQLRNLHEKVGLEYTQLENAAGFGFLHDGTADSLARFVGPPAFVTTSLQDIADLVAFLLCFAGSDLPEAEGNVFEPIGPAGRDTHAGVGQQFTLNSFPPPAGAALVLTAAMQLAQSGAVGLVAKGRRGGEARGWTFVGGSLFQSDRSAQQHGAVDLALGAAPGAEITFTIVPSGSQTRIGVDRDEDGFFDRDELDHGTDPTNPASVPCLVDAPSAPRALAALTLGEHTIELTWIDESLDEEDFLVLRRAQGTPGFAEVAVLPPDTTVFRDTGLPCMTDFVYRIVARNCAGESASDELAGETATCLRAAAVPGKSASHP